MGTQKEKGQKGTTGEPRYPLIRAIRLMDKILHYLKDPKLWELRYIPYYGSCRILSISRKGSSKGHLGSPGGCQAEKFREGLEFGVVGFLV